MKNYGFSELNDSNSSSLFVLSGTILGNPFLLQKARLHEIKDKVYTGTKVISWTEYYYDSEGHRRSRTRTQTLTATSTHPAPFYHNEVTLIYGNDAAPDLSFSRKPSGLGGMSEKEYDKYVKKDYYNTFPFDISKEAIRFLSLLLLIVNLNFYLVLITAIIMFSIDYSLLRLLK